MYQSLPLYYIFNCVAQAGNISHAAKQLYISQPAVSKAVAALEENLQVTLFARSSRGVRLTSEGQLLYEHTRQAFDILSRGEETIRQIHALGIGQLKIGVSATLCKHLLLPYLNLFVKEYPHIKITIECQSSYHTMKQLENNSLDIGLIAKPANDHSFQFDSLGLIQDIFVATPSYLEHLKLREETTDIFSSANIMLLDENNVSRQHIEKYFNENHIKPKQILEVSNMDLMIDFAKTGLGVGCVIKEFVQSEIDQGDLVQIPLDIPVKKREVGFSYSKNAFLSDSMQKFLQFITKHDSYATQ